MRLWESRDFLNVIGFANVDVRRLDVTVWPESSKNSLALFCIIFEIKRDHFYRAMLCKRGLCCHAVSVCLSLCPSVTFVDHVKTNKHIFEFFSPSGSDTILGCPYQRGCRYSDGNPPNGDVECMGGMIKWRFFSQISRCISERVIVRWAHAARQFVTMEFSFHPYNI